MAHFESEGFWNSEVAYSAIFFRFLFFSTALFVGNVLYN